MRMKSNARELAEKVAKFQREMRPALVEGANAVFDRVGTLATGRYMRMTAGGSGSPVAGRLTVRSVPQSGMARSLLPGGGAFGPGGKREQIRRLRWRGSRLIGEFGTSVEYARIHEKGGVILPRRAQALHFIPQGGRKEVFAKKVKIPPRPFLGPAVRETAKEARRIFAGKIEEAIAKAGFK